MEFMTCPDCAYVAGTPEALGAHRASHTTQAPRCLVCTSGLAMKLGASPYDAGVFCSQACAVRYALHRTQGHEWCEDCEAWVGASGRAGHDYYHAEQSRST